MVEDFEAVLQELPTNSTVAIKIKKLMESGERALAHLYYERINTRAQIRNQRRRQQEETNRRAEILAYVEEEMRQAQMESANEWMESDPAHED